MLQYKFRTIKASSGEYKPIFSGLCYNFFSVTKYPDVSVIKEVIKSELLVTVIKSIITRNQWNFIGV